MKKETEGSGVAAVIIVLNGSEKPTYMPVLTGDIETEIPGYLAKQARVLETRIVKQERQRENLSRFKANNRLRRKAQLKEMRECLEKEIRTNFEKKEALEGKRLIPIKLIREGGKVKAFELSTFAQEEEKNWWKFVLSNRLLPQVASLAGKYPNALPLLTEAFDLRTRLGKALTTEDVELAKEMLRQFSHGYSQKVSDEQAEEMIPVMKAISQVGSL